MEMYNRFLKSLNATHIKLCSENPLDKIDTPIFKIPGLTDKTSKEIHEFYVNKLLNSLK